MMTVKKRNRGNSNWHNHDILIKKKKKSAGGRVHLHRHTPLTQSGRCGLRWLCSPGIMLKSDRETSSHANRQGTLVHIRLSSLSHCWLSLVLTEWNWCARADLISTLERKRTGGEWFVEPSPIILACEEKVSTTTTMICISCEWERVSALRFFKRNSFADWIYHSSSRQTDEVRRKLIAPAFGPLET